LLRYYYLKFIIYYSIFWQESFVDYKYCINIWIFLSIWATPADVQKTYHSVDRMLLILSRAV